MVREVKRLRGMGLEELKGELESARTELRNLRMKLHTIGPSEIKANTRDIRRRIARILTIIREKELAER